MRNAVGGAVPVTEWDRLSAPSRAEVESLVEVLKSVESRATSASAFDYEKKRRAQSSGRDSNDIIGFNEHLSGEILRVGRSSGRKGRCTSAPRSGRPGERGRRAHLGEPAHRRPGAPTNEVARLIPAVARGDLSQKMILEIDGRPVRGEFLASAPPSTRWSISQLVRGGGYARCEGGTRERREARDRPTSKG